jgi:hypothetical protein
MPASLLRAVIASISVPAGATQIARKSRILRDVQHLSEFSRGRSRDRVHILQSEKLCRFVRFCRV